MTKREKGFLIHALFFAAVFLVDLWGTAYIIHVCAEDSWLRFPVITTALVIGILSLILCAGAIACWKDEPRSTIN